MEARPRRQWPRSRSYDMAKGIERGVEVGRVTLLEKTGGKEDGGR